MTNIYIFLYSVFITIYRLTLYVVSLWNPKARNWVKGRQGILNKLVKSGIGSHSQIIWIHCASLGEFEQGRPLIEKLKSQFPNTEILVTFFSPSGYEVTKNYNGADYIFYLPLATRKTAKRFIEIINPKLVLWVKYDYWYHYLEILKTNNIPTLLVSGIFWRGQTFFSWYGVLHRKMLHCFTYIFVQTEGSKRLLENLGFTDNVAISGDTRFDRVVEIAEKFEDVPLILEFCGNRKVIVAGSTWEEDDEELDHFANTNPDIAFVIAPHEIDEMNLKNVEKLFRRSIRYSQWLEQNERLSLANGDNINTLIIDNIGMLSRLYKYATIAYVGGGFGDTGVHNVLEAAVYGKPVIFGPVFDKYMEAIELLEEGGGITIETALELEKTLHDLLTNDQFYSETCNASKNYVYSKTGATKKILQYIQEKRLLTN